MARTHRDLRVWQEAMELVQDVYRETAGFPRQELFGLMSQMRRAAVSIPSSIAEGAARGGTREFVQFLSVARGSLSELDTQIAIARRLGYLAGDQRLGDRLSAVFRLMNALLHSLESRAAGPRT